MLVFLENDSPENDWAFARWIVSGGLFTARSPGVSNLRKSLLPSSLCGSNPQAGVDKVVDVICGVCLSIHLKRFPHQF